MQFSLHPRLAADTQVVDELPLCRVLLMNDARFPWLILVPRKADIREVYQLSSADQACLWQEVTQVGEALMAEFSGEKLNVAALGNQVSQLHLHVIVRFKDDVAWPGPVWGVGKPRAYAIDELSKTLTRLRALLNALPE